MDGYSMLLMTKQDFKSHKRLCRHSAISFNLKRGFFIVQVRRLLPQQIIVIDFQPVNSLSKKLLKTPFEEEL